MLFKWGGGVSKCPLMFPNPTEFNYWGGGGSEYIDCLN